MTVEELINKLRELPGDMRVVFTDTANEYDPEQFVILNDKLVIGEDWRKQLRLR